MKNSLTLLLLAVIGTACQHKAPPTQVGAAAPMATKIARKNKPPAAASPVSADTLTAPMRSLLQHYNLAALWRGHDPEARDSVAVLDGFFGPDHYRISFVFTQARQDSADLAVFHVSGKSRYKQQITPFTGTLRVQKIADLDRRYLDLAPDDSLTQGYTASAKFALLESNATPNAGKFEGVGTLDFYISPGGQVGYGQVMAGEGAPARGQGLLFKGIWVGTKTGQRKDLLLARSVFSIAPDVLKNFAIGERDATINPKYAKLGWDKYWENDEWWADSPQVTMNL